MSGFIRSLRFLVLAVLVTVTFAACGDDDDATAAGDDPATTRPSTDDEDEPEGDVTTSTTAPQADAMVEPVVEGTPEVFTAEYGLPDTSGWNTYVAFQVRNPADVDLAEVAYRVEVSSTDGATAGRTDGSDTIALRANETRWVVAKLDPTGPTPPATANVTVYATSPEDPGDTALYGDAVHGDPALWESSSRFFDCDGFTVGCTVTADVVFTGDVAQRIVEIVIVARDGADGSGPVTFAGVGDYVDATVQPGQTIPVSGHAVQHTTNVPGDAGLAEILVFSVPA